MESRTTYSTAFIVRASRSNKEGLPIYCRITVNSQRSEFSIKTSAPENIWDNGKAKGNSEAAKRINSYLKQIEAKVFEHYREMLAKNELVTADGLKNAYLGIVENQQSLMSLIKYHNEIMKDQLEWGTMKNYGTTQKYVTMFLEKQFRTSDIFLTQLNYKFIVDFEMFLKAHQPTDHQKPCGQNTAMKHIERFRKMINMAIKYEWLERDPFMKFKASFKKTTRQSLTNEELQKIEDKNFKIPRLQQVKDLFVFSCYTGLAYSDVMELKPSNVNIGMDGKNWITTSRKKTDMPVRIPLLGKALSIIEKYKEHPSVKADGSLLPGISNQKLNSYLKEIADLCEVPKNLTFHLARHTFATTITLTNGVPIETVSKLLGHSSIRTTQIYAKVVEKKVSDDMEILRQKIEGAPSIEVTSRRTGS